MSKRATGMVFISIAAFLYAVRYVSAAIYGSGLASWSRSLYKDMLSYIGSAPLVLSVLSLIAGILYLLWAEIGEISERLKRGFEKIREYENRANEPFFIREEAEAEEERKP